MTDLSDRQDAFDNPAKTSFCMLRVLREGGYRE